MAITGKDLIGWGFEPGSHFPEMLKKANDLRTVYDAPDDEIIKSISSLAPVATETISLKSHSEGANGFESYLGYGMTGSVVRANHGNTFDTMAEVMRTPVAEQGVLMPDACPAGPVGTIPVGGVVSSAYIHPGWHSADICCSVMCSIFPKAAGVDPRDLLSAVQATTHFGGGGRDGERFPFIETAEVVGVLETFDGNRFLHDLMTTGMEHMGTQGDGNHFSFVGHLRSTGEVCLVTHHGSRKPGAMLYKKGIALAEKQTREICPDIARQNAWIVNKGDAWEYWDALQIIRQWTKLNHLAIHKMAEDRIGVAADDQFWNEHNFVFQRDDGKFYHAKGATPMFDYHPDVASVRLIPLNMGSPILITASAGVESAASLGFAPHGAGRNMSRTQHRKQLSWTEEEQVLVETDGLDIRFWTGKPDVSELPSAYKDPDVIVSEIEKHSLARVVDYIDPYGSLMAGEWQTKPRRKAGKEVA